MKPISGRAWIFGDDINTDLLAPGRYFKAPLAEMARHCLASVDPDFAGQVRPGDIIVAGRNFGMGSAREQAAMVLCHLGIGAVLAASFGRIFWRNALNFGLPVLRFSGVADVHPGETLVLEPDSGLLHSAAGQRHWQLEPLPVHLHELLAAGGLMPWLQQQISSGRLTVRPLEPGGHHVP